MSEPINVDVNVNVNENQLQLINFSQAKALKDAGFDWECETAFLDRHGDITPVSGGIQNWNMHNDVLYSRPTVALALKWLREKKGLHVYVSGFVELWYFKLRHTDISIRFNAGVIMQSSTFTTHDLAESAGLDKALELPANKNNTTANDQPIAVKSDDMAKAYASTRALPGNQQWHSAYNHYIAIEKWREHQSATDWALFVKARYPDACIKKEGIEFIVYCPLLNKRLSDFCQTEDEAWCSAKIKIRNKG